MKDLEKIRKRIVESGSITSRDVSALKTIVYTDGKVNRAEADFLFALKQDINDIGFMKTWNSFFIRAICDHLLDADHSSEPITDIDAAWLADKIGEDRIIDDTEELLMKTLHKKANRFPETLAKMEKHISIPRKIGRSIFRALCSNTTTAHTLET